MVVAYTHLSERDRNMQDGPEVGLIGHLRFLLGVTEADQGDTSPIAQTMVNKADHGPTADQGQHCSRHKRSC